MSRSKALGFVACALALAGSILTAQSADSKQKITFLDGPTNAPLGSMASINVPAGFRFIDGKTTRALLKAEGEPVSDSILGLMAPTNADWSVMFEFAGIGYVKDDDKDKLDADKLLASIKAGTEAANKERQRNGNPPLEVVGWEVPPKYDAATHNLEWAVRATCEGRPILNYNTRLLGRKGVMEVVLIVKPDMLGDTLPTFREMLAGYSYQSGQTYAEYRSGDKLAKYGLGALVVGGAAVGAAKLGLFTALAVFLKKGWKLVVLAFAGIASFFKKLFTGRSKKKSE